MTLREKLANWDNDYSHLEPFINNTPISSSIIIPVYNEDKLLEKTLSNLSAHPQLNKIPDLFEIILVDDGSSEEINRLVKKMNFPCCFNYFRFNDNKGRSKARNKGISMAKNELLFFFDSDILIPHNYFKEHWKIHNSTKKAVVPGFAENIEPGDSRLESLTNGEDVQPNIYKDFRFNKDLSGILGISEHCYLMRDSKDFKEFGFQKKIGIWTLPYMVVSHNLSVRKEKVLHVNCFNEEFKGWGFEDTHLGAKLICSGCYVIPVESTGVFRIKHKSRQGTEKDRIREMYENMKLYEHLLDEGSTC